MRHHSENASLSPSAGGTEDKIRVMKRAGIILAAGRGGRMKSSLPKVLHPVGGRAMLDRAIDTAEALGCEKIVVVVGGSGRRSYRERRGIAALARAT